MAEADGIIHDDYEQRLSHLSSKHEAETIFLDHLRQLTGLEQTTQQNLLERMEQLTGVKAPESTLTQDLLLQVGKEVMSDERATQEHGLKMEYLEQEQMLGNNREREDEMHKEAPSLPAREREMELTREREAVHEIVQDFVMEM